MQLRKTLWLLVLSGLLLPSSSYGWGGKARRARAKTTLHAALSSKALLSNPGNLQLKRVGGTWTTTRKGRQLKIETPYGFSAVVKGRRVFVSRASLDQIADRIGAQSEPRLPNLVAEELAKVAPKIVGRGASVHLQAGPNGTPMVETGGRAATALVALSWRLARKHNAQPPLAYRVRTTVEKSAPQRQADRPIPSALLEVAQLGKSYKAGENRRVDRELKKLLGYEPRAGGKYSLSKTGNELSIHEETSDAWARMDFYIGKTAAGQATFACYEDTGGNRF